MDQWPRYGVARQIRLMTFVRNASAQPAQVEHVQRPDHQFRIARRPADVAVERPQLLV
jgi:hypothetical protein